jgi:hypothetical protein
MCSRSHNREIAATLVVEEPTIRTHVKRLPMKLDLRNRVQAVIFAYETGLNRPGGGAPNQQVRSPAMSWQLQRLGGQEAVAVASWLLPSQPWDAPNGGRRRHGGHAPRR